MKRLTEAQAELIDAFLAKRAERISTAQIEKDLLISEVFSVFTEPVVYREHEAKFVLCGGTAVSKAHHLTERISEDIDLRVVVPSRMSRSAQKRLLSLVKSQVLDRLRSRGSTSRTRPSKRATGITTSRSSCPMTPSIRRTRRFAQNS